MRRLIYLSVLATRLMPGGDLADIQINAVEKHYNAAKTLTVEFVESYSVLGRKRLPESGNLALRKQGKMRWDYDRPAGKVFVCDGKTISLYTAADHRVAKIPMKQTDDLRAPLAFLLGRLDMRKEFQDFEVLKDSRGQWLKARAKSERVPYIDLQMLVRSNGAIEELTVHGRDQSTLTFAFRNEQVNPTLPESLFHFLIPPGTEVVDAIPSQTEAQ